MAANPRAAAVAALVRQEQDGFSNLVLDAELRRQKLEGRDKAFAGAIFYTVLEHQGTLDFILEQFLPKGLARLDPQVREILRAALAQARYMQVPVSAAVNEAVKLTRTFKKASASGLVNAVLRKACNYDLETARFRNETQRLMVLGSAGQDVAEFLRTHYPEEALGILTHTADGGCTSLRANPPESGCRGPLRKAAGKRREERTARPCARQCAGPFEGSPAEQALFRRDISMWRGRPASWRPSVWRQSPAIPCSTSARPPAAKRCCWPRRCRGRARCTAATWQSTASGSSGAPWNGWALPMSTALCNDATRPNPKLPAADRILVDAPCSGLGILAKKPDIRYKTLEKARHDELLATQSAILDTAAALLKAGGRLVYSTCTIDPAENEEQVAAFLVRHPEFRVVRPAVAFPAWNDGGGTRGALGAHPHRDGRLFPLCHAENPMNPPSGSY